MFLLALLYLVTPCISTQILYDRTACPNKHDSQVINFAPCLDRALCLTSFICSNTTHPDSAYCVYYNNNTKHGYVYYIKTGTESFVLSTKLFLFKDTPLICYMNTIFVTKGNDVIVFTPGTNMYTKTYTLDQQPVEQMHRINYTFDEVMVNNHVNWELLLHRAIVNFTFQYVGGRYSSFKSLPDATTPDATTPDVTTPDATTPHNYPTDECLHLPIISSYSWGLQIIPVCILLGVMTVIMIPLFSVYFILYKRSSYVTISQDSCFYILCNLLQCKQRKRIVQYKVPNGPLPDIPLTADISCTQDPTT